MFYKKKNYTELIYLCKIVLYEGAVYYKFGLSYKFADFNNQIYEFV